MRKVKRLGTEPVRKLLWEFAVPAIIGMLVNALYNVVDRFFIGQGCGREAIAGVSLSFPFMAILAAFGTLIGVGSGALLSIKLGERRKAEAEMVVGQCVAVKLLFFLTLPFAVLYYLDPLLVAFGSTPEALPYARAYMRIILYCNVLQHLSFGLSNLMRAEGRASRSMHCMVIGAVANTILDPLFIFTFKMGVEGAAWATNLAMGLSCAYAFYYYLSGQSEVRMRWKRIRVFPKMLGQVFSIGLSPFLLQTMMGAVTIAFNRMFLKWAPDSAAATVEIAAMGIATTVLTLFLMPVFGLTQGMQPIAGYNFGAKAYERVREIYGLCMRSATIMCAIVTVTVLVFAQPLVRGFTTDPVLLHAGTRGLRIYACMFVTIGVPIVTVAYYQSIGRAAMAIALSMMRQGVMLLPFILALPHFWGVIGIWLASPASDFFSSVVTDLIGWREYRRLKALAAAQNARKGSSALAQMA